MTIHWKKILALMMKWVVYPGIGAIVSIVFISRLTAFWRASEYKVYVVSNFNEDLAAQIGNEFCKEMNVSLKIDGVDVKTYKKTCRQPDEARQFAENIARSNNVLMVIGHFYSSQTEAALPYYLNASPPVPVILTTETNPRLLPVEFTGKACPVFRLSPTDDQQAKTAADFAIGQENASTFWVVEDTDNPVYSHYLAEEFINQVQTQGRKVVLRSNNLTIPSIELGNPLKADCVFFAGKPSNALILIRQISALWDNAKMPIVILSDWAVDPTLIEQGGQDVEGIYLTHQLSADVYNSYGYALYGSDAANIVKTLVSDADEEFSTRAKKRGAVGFWLKRLLNIRRVKDARYVINSLMEDAETAPCRVFTSARTQEEYRFQGKALRENAAFNIWTIDKGQFAQVRID